MLRKAVEFLLFVILFILQMTVFQFFKIASVSPNLLVILVASFGFIKGKKEGLIVGFFCGVFMDLYFSNTLGVYALFYMLVGYLNGFFKNEFFPEDIKMPLILIGFSDIIYNILIFLGLFLFRGRFNLGYYFLNIILPEVVYTVLISVILYPVILRINNWIEKYEKRSASKFG